MSFLDGDFYTEIDDPNKRIAIITTDYNEKDPHYEWIVKDVESVKSLLKRLGFQEKKIKVLHNVAKNVISKKTSDHCTFDEQNNGYILMFNLTYKMEGRFRAGQSWYTSNDIHEIFEVNNLHEWSSKPKLIFNRNSVILKPEIKAPNEEQDKGSDPIMEIPINMDIFESFSGSEDSYGDANGSFYIQALCKTINQHIDNPMPNKDITDIMYAVHAEIYEMVRETGKSPRQTPFYKTTHVKKFMFPL